MSDQITTILRIPESVKNDTLSYRVQVEKYINGETSPISFRAYRVPIGIYEQRTTGKFMVRIRVGAGLILPSQLHQIAKLSEAYGNGILHVTTRQDIQIHEVSIEDTASVLEGLLEAGLSSRGGGGNTVRNVSACPLAGVCSNQVFDVSPYSIATAEYLLSDKSSFNLPRKYKIAFSGCSKDCAFASVADLGFFAHIKDGVKGFSVYAAGGLGSNPAVAVQIEDFIKADEVFEVSEAIKRVFDKHGDRSNKHRARLRYVLSRVGIDEFIKLYKAERQSLRAEGLSNVTPGIRDILSQFPIPEKSVTVRLWLKKGDIPADDLDRVGQIAAKYSNGLVRTSQMQDLFITGVSPEDVDKVNSELKSLSANVFADRGPKVVACTGAATCKLGLCLSRGLADAISDRLADTGQSDTVVRISGCPNSCANHFIAQLGFQGKAKRVNGKLLPCYDVFFGGKTAEADAHLAQSLGTVPAKRVPDLLAEVFGNGAIEKESLKQMVGKYGNFGEDSLPEDFYYDWDSNEPFSLAGRGPGECGAGVTDVIKLDIDEAKHAISGKCADSESVYKATVSASRALLFVFGLEPKKDREIFSAFKQHLIQPGWVKPDTQLIFDNALDWKMGDVGSIENLLPQVKELIARIEELFVSLDANLKFKADPIVQKSDLKTDESKNHQIDLRGVSCPINFVKAKLELEKLKIGDILEVLLDEGEPVRNVPASFADQGQHVLGVENFGGCYRVKVLRER